MIPTGMIIGIAGLIVLVALIVLGIPIWIALLLVGSLGTVMVIGFPATMASLATTPYHMVATFAFAVIPLFVLMGDFALHAGIGDELYAAARSWVGRLHGGLAMATALGCALFAMITGSILATVATFTKVALPEMRRHNYDDKLSTAVIVASGTLACLIPPSGLMIFFCIMTGASLGKLMLAGFIPGFLSAMIYMVMINIWSRKNPRLGPPLPMPVSWKEKALAFRWLGPVGIIMVVMLGGIYLGVFSPSEAAAIGAFCTFTIALIRKSLSLGKLKTTLLETATTTTSIMFIIIAAIIFGKFLTVSGLATTIIDFFVALPVPAIVTVTLILLVYVAGGTVIPGMPLLAMTLPIVFPLLTESLGYDPIWIGVLCIKIVEVAAITPPVGLNLYVVKAVSGMDVHLEDTIRGVLPFFVMDILTIALLVAFPQICLWLPSKMF
jgi:C4-dicarboxylate transporter DctM subunit